MLLIENLRKLFKSYKNLNIFHLPKMSFISIYLLSLSFCISFTSSSHPTSCGHNFLQSHPHPDTQELPRVLATNAYFANSTINAEKARIAQNQSSLFSNVRIVYDYQFFDTSLLTASKLDFLQNNLLVSIQNFYESTIKLFPKQKPIIPNSKICNYATLVVNQSILTNGYNNADMVLYVIAENNGSENYIAWASVCQLDSDLLGRPMVGLVNLNFYYFDWEVTGYQNSFNTLAHELFHFFVFSSNLYPFYVSEEGVTLGIDNVIQADGSKYKLILNMPVSYGVSFYNCSTFNGVWLENNDPLTIGSHFEDTFYRDELMSPIDRPNKKFSNFSFNLLASSGWYMVDFSNVQDYRFGYQEGCDFIALACKRTPLFSEYCSVANTQGCQEDFSGFGVCTANSFLNDNCLTSDSSSTLMCNYNSNADFQTIVGNQGGLISPDSYCFNSLLGKAGTSRYDASCYPANCYWNTIYSNYSINVTVENIQKSCIYDGERVEVTGYANYLICPKITEFCEYNSISCPGGCNNEQGVCSTTGVCHYYKGQGICSGNCSSCLNSLNCLVCEPGYYKTVISNGVICSSTATCQSSQYMNNDTGLCFNCDSSCLTCKGAGSTNCSSCSIVKYLNDSICSLCTTQDPFCSRCNLTITGDFNCLECNSTNSFVNSSYLCENCSSSCLTCNGNTNESCLSCDNGHYLENSQCLACDSTCTTCKGVGSSNCTSCPVTRYLTGNNCPLYDCSGLNSCSECKKINNILVCDLCKDGWFLNTDNICNVCNNSCLKCSKSSSNCTSCKLGTFLNSSLCTDCDISCKNCTGPSENQSDCSQCNVNYGFNSDNQCKSIICDNSCKDCVGTTANDCYSCYNGFYLIQTNNTCDNCSINCSTCSGPNKNECLSCESSLNLIDGYCKNASLLTPADITEIISLEGLKNFTNLLNLDNYDTNIAKNTIQTIINKIYSLIEINSTNLTRIDLSSLGNILKLLINTSSVSNSTWNSSFTSEFIDIITKVSNSFGTNAKTLVISDSSTEITFMNSLSSLKTLNNETSDNAIKKLNEKNIHNAANTIINSNIHILIYNSTPIISNNSLCNYQLAAFFSVLNNNQSLSVSSTSQNTGNANILINNDFLSKISTGNTYVKLVQWVENPYLYNDPSNTSNLSSIISISFYNSDSNGYNRLNISNLSPNKSFGLPKIKGQSVNSTQIYQCVYWNETNTKWANDGVSTVQPGSSDGVLNCISSHFTDFAFTIVTNTTVINNNSGGNNTYKMRVGFSTILLILVIVCLIIIM